MNIKFVRSSKWALPAVAGLVLLAGCGTQDGSNPVGSAVPTTSSEAPEPGGTDASAAQIKAAGIAPCPTSATPSPGSHGLPDLTLACLGEGPAVNLAGLAGKPYVINVWASWCGPCRAEVPIMASIYRQSKGQLGFLGIDMADDRVAALEFAGTTNMGFPSVMDPDSKIRAGLGIVGVPTTLFVKADGTVAGRVNEVTSEDQLKQLISDNLQVTL